jgi:hypothetical protein
MPAWSPSPGISNKTATIRRRPRRSRILRTAGLVTPEPRKRHRSSYRRSEAAQPNECWQSDFTHWRQADGIHVETLSWLDDHCRYLIALPSWWRPATCSVSAPDG